MLKFFIGLLLFGLILGLILLADRIDTKYPKFWSKVGWGIFHTMVIALAGFCCYAIGDMVVWMFNGGTFTEYMQQGGFK